MNSGGVDAGRASALVHIVTGGTGAGVALHWLDIPVDVRWDRVQQRNRDRGATYAMDVDRAMFDFMEGEWEAPSTEELARLNGRVVTL